MLNETDYAEAVRRYKDRNLDEDERQRCHALILAGQEFNPDKIAAILLVAEETVSHWLEDYEKNGLRVLQRETAKQVVTQPDKAPRPAFGSREWFGQFGKLIACVWLGGMSAYLLYAFWPVMESITLPANRSNLDLWFLGTVFFGCVGGLVALRLYRGHLVRWGLVLSPLALTLLLALLSRQLMSVLTFFYLAGIACLYGLAILRLLRAQFDDLAEPLTLSLIFGFGSLSLLVLGAGLLGLLHKPMVWSGSALLAFVCFVVARQSIKTCINKLVLVFQEPPPDWLVIGCCVPLALFFALNLVFSLSPEIVFDALKSHLALAKIFATEHRVMGIPHSLGSYWPIGGDLLFTVGYLLGGETTAKLLHLLAGILATATVYVLGKRLHSSTAGVVAATVFYTAPFISWESSTAYLDLFIAMYAGATLVALYTWLTKRDWASAWCMGLSLGFAFGIKPTGGFFALGVGLVILYFWIFGQLAPRKKVFASLVVVTGVTTLVGGVWYLRAYLLTGNPVFPFLNGMFRSPYWYPSNPKFNYDLWGIGKTPASMARLLWALTFQTGRFGEFVEGSFGLVFLPFLPLFFFFAKVKREFIVLLLTCFVFFLAWFLSVQYLRYMTPIVPFLALLAGLAIVTTWQHLTGRNRWLASLVPVIFFTLILFNFRVTLMNHWSLPTNKPTDVLLGRVPREKYREKVIPAANTLAYANANLPKESTRIYGVNEYFQFLVDAPLLYPFFSVVGDQILASQQEDELLRLLEQEQINYLLINFGTLPSSWGFLIKDRVFLEKHAKLVYAYNNVHLYRLLKRGEVCQNDTWQDLLKNPGFEEVDAETPSFWTKVGTGVVVTPPLALSGNKSIQVDPLNGFYQTVAVTEQKLYTFSALIKSQQPEKINPKLQVVWVDAANQPLDWSIAVLEAGPSAQPLSMSVTAPPGAKTALLYLLTYAGTALVDDATFRMRVHQGQCP